MLLPIELNIHVHECVCVTHIAYKCVIRHNQKLSSLVYRYFNIVITLDGYY